MKNFFSKKLVVVGLSSLAIGVVGTVGVFAAIPDSNTKVISACRNNITGALKAINAENGANCNIFETSLSWSGDLAPSSSGGFKTAVFNTTPDSSDPDFPYIYNSTHSRSIVGVKQLVANDPVNNPADIRGYCVDLGFTVLYASDTSPNSGRVTYPALLDGTEFETAIVDACGTGFEAFVSSDPSSTTRSVLFSE